MSARRMGCRVYSHARASLTSFLTICSRLLPSPWVSPSTAASPSQSSFPEDTSDGGVDCRRRAGGGEIEASAFCCCQFVQGPG
ncbi:MAG: hypothetical protein Q9214_004079, partial [Letrouitia sp. 1 TL-2023]